MSKYTEHLRVTAKALLEIADEQDKREASPQPVATLCEGVSRFLGTIHDWHTINLGKARLQEALSAERKRAVLVGELLEYLGFYINAEESAVSERYYYELVRRYRALEAFDKGVENG